MNSRVIPDYFVAMTCLSPSEAEDAARRATALRPHWTERFKLDTLGATTHLDFLQPPSADVLVRLAQGNVLIRENFGWVLARIRLLLEHLLEGPVDFAADLPVPGLMIYQGAVAGEIKDRWHADLQFELHDWSRYQRVDFSNPITFTLPLALPAFPTGMMVWPTARHSQWFQQEELGKPLSFAGRNEPIFLPYVVGALIVHPGTFLHALHNEPGDPDLSPRITVQGHALLCDGTWRIYW